MRLHRLHGSRSPSFVVELGGGGGLVGRRERLPGGSSRKLRALSELP